MSTKTAAEEGGVVSDERFDARRVEREFSKRKYRWFLFEFEHDEDGYQGFAFYTNYRMILWCRVVAVLLQFGVLIAVPIEGQSFSAAALGWLSR